MAQINSNSESVKGVVNSWSLIAFVKEFGKMQVGNFCNHKTSEIFPSCIFTHPTKKTAEGKPERKLVGFARKLGVLTPEEIAARKYELKVVQLASDNYKLCTAGEESWVDVDI